VLVQRDYNDRDSFELDLPQPPFTGDAAYAFDYDSYYVGGGAIGRLSDRMGYGVELAFQGGRTRSDLSSLAPLRGENGTINRTDPPQQSTDSIAAAALDVRADYLFDGPARTRLSGEVVLATGDGDRNHTSNTVGGNQPGTTTGRSTPSG
jgi:hypothetical protein